MVSNIIHQQKLYQNGAQKKIKLISVIIRHFHFNEVFHNAIDEIKTQWSSQSTSINPLTAVCDDKKSNK